MKSSNLILSFIFLSVLFLPSCDTTPPDPAGTNTISLNYTTNAYIILYQGLEEGPDQSWPYVQILLRIFDASMNFGFTAIQSMDPDITTYNIHNGTGGEMVNLGSVGGLGAITDKPSSGWVGSTAVEQGTGYVFRFKHTYQYSTASIPYVYGRLYVEDILTNVSGGIIGAKVKYQFPF